ncbi:uncharacterized protein LOC143225760 [Tachypleus tridentatus]|uniref:uncharacterized protein LOC143225760 n=1 Tax=Tachypleus tridentatus TaxID=6853 RepID=UPI003FD2147D
MYLSYCMIHLCCYDLGLYDSSLTSSLESEDSDVQCHICNVILKKSESYRKHMSVHRKKSLQRKKEEFTEYFNFPLYCDPYESDLELWCEDEDHRNSFSELKLDSRAKKQVNKTSKRKTLKELPAPFFSRENCPECKEPFYYRKSFLAHLRLIHKVTDESVLLAIKCKDHEDPACNRKQRNLEDII